MRGSGLLDGDRGTGPIGGSRVEETSGSVLGEGHDEAGGESRGDQARKCGSSGGMGAATP